MLHNGQSFSNSPSTPTPKSSLLSKTSSLISAVTSSTLSATLNTTGSLLKTAGTATTNYVIAPTATVVARDVLPEIIRLVYQVRRETKLLASDVKLCGLAQNKLFASEHGAQNERNRTRYSLARFTDLCIPRPD